MKTLTAISFSSLLFLFISGISSQTIRTFPQKEINDFSASALKQLQNYSLPVQKNKSIVPAGHSVINTLRQLSSNNLPGINLNNNPPPTVDTVTINGNTLVVGLTPNDTLRITGNWTHIGSIYVIGNGVLIFDNANATIEGNIVIAENGKAFSDSSFLHLPQQWWYQRAITVVHNGYMNFSNTTFNYDNYPHGFSVMDSAKVFLTNINNTDYTTTNMVGNASITINGNNLTGEFVVADSANLSLKNVTNVLLWHRFTDTAVINHTFPPGSTLYSYAFNKNTPGVNGINYNITVDTCYNVEWAVMPSGGSDVTISNSTIRSVGLRFEGNDTSNVSGLINNSNYSNFIAPLSDRNLHFINTFVQTWSIYTFDSTVVNISGCTVGEVGLFEHSKAQGINYLVDGSGGYCFTADSSFMYNEFCSVSANVRSEGYSTHVFAYSTQSNGVASAIGNSLLIVVQSTLPQDPIPYDGGCVWLANIPQPDTAYIDSIIPVVGSAWIDKTAISTWDDFGAYRVWYQKASDTIWTAVGGFVSVEVRNNTLALWNTYGLTPGLYNLRLTLYDNWDDSVDAIKQVSLLPALTSTGESSLSEMNVHIYPNPSNGEFQLEINNGLLTKNYKLKLFDFTGTEVKSSIIRNSDSFVIRYSDLPNGIYFLKITTDEFSITRKLEIIR